MKPMICYIIIIIILIVQTTRMIIDYRTTCGPEAEKPHVGNFQLA